MAGTLKIKLGEEYKAKIENIAEFKDSVFKELYVKAFEKTREIIDSGEEKEEDSEEEMTPYDDDDDDESESGEDETQTEEKKGGKKSNGHKPNCKCPICKNMRKTKRGGDIEEGTGNSEEEIPASSDEYDELDAAERGEHSAVGGSRKNRRRRRGKSRRTRKNHRSHRHH